MDFIIEKISEDSFFINLLLGLPKVLESLEITEYNLTRRLAATETDIMHWEHKNSVILPDDLRNFYCSTNGFLYEWFYNFGEESLCGTNIHSKDEDSLSTQVTGKIEVNSLDNLRQIYGYVTSNEPGIFEKENLCEIRLSLDSKVFEICSLPGGKVVLVYLFPKVQPSIWLFTYLMEFCYITKDFKSYIKMCIAHLGIPNWQFVFSSDGISEWTKSLFRLLAPHLLPELKLLSPKESFKSKGNTIISHINKIDPIIFKSRIIQQVSHSKLENLEPPSPQTTKPISNREREKQNQNLLKKHPQIKTQRKPLYYVKRH